MRIATGAVVAICLLLVGFTAGVSIGRISGFTAGSEWALLQADILAREAGVFMPVSLNDGNFKIIIRQPRNIYRNAWKLADRHFAEQAAKSAGSTGATRRGAADVPAVHDEESSGPSRGEAVSLDIAVTRIDVLAADRVPCGNADIDSRDAGLLPDRAGREAGEDRDAIEGAEGRISACVGPFLLPSGGDGGYAWK